MADLLGHPVKQSILIEQHRISGPLAPFAERLVRLADWITFVFPPDAWQFKEYFSRLSRPFAAIVTGVSRRMWRGARMSPRAILREDPASQVSALQLLKVMYGNRDKSRWHYAPPKHTIELQSGMTSGMILDGIPFRRILPAA